MHVTLLLDIDSFCIPIHIMLLISVSSSKIKERDEGEFGFKIMYRFCDRTRFDGSS